MNGWAIGRVAKHFGLSPSTLRYYEQRNLIRPARTPAGVRCYDREQLRRVAFLRLASDLGISLDTVAKILDRPRAQWQDTVQIETTTIEQRITAARRALALLSATSHCPHDAPGRTCPDLREALDLIVDGSDLDDLARLYG